MGDADESIPPPTLRGWLSVVYFPALLRKEHAALVTRLGSRASVDDPIRGRTEGTAAALQRHLVAAEKWLEDLGAEYRPGPFTTGADRDVSEGKLVIHAGPAYELPVAVVSERRRSREVLVRVYYAASEVGGNVRRAPLLAVERDNVLPDLLERFTHALRAGSMATVLECFETDGELVDGMGRRFKRRDGRLERWLRDRLGAGVSPGCDLAPSGYAEGGSTAALEYTAIRVGGEEVPARAGLLVMQRGDYGRAREVRLYDEALDGR